MCGGVFGAIVGYWLGVSFVRCQFLYCASVVCLYLGVFMGGFRWGITLGAGKAMLMRGGACAAELCLMDGCVCLSNAGCYLLSRYWFSMRVFLFLVFGVIGTVFGRSLHGFGGGCVVSIR